ncbi:MAG: asparagine synthase C-terminal domain-containing protein [Thaumarchaeota archaeon]|nr:asparagine synthase C-terminal domain-containing protein [Nitrososphaerota archaeon]
MTPYSGTFEEAAQELARAIDLSVSESVSGIGRAAVAFSGGLDSSTIVACARKKVGAVACAAFAKGSVDSARAAAAAEALGVELVATELSEGLVHEELRSISLPFEPTLMDRSLWSLYSIVSRSASKAGAKRILLGQLADELFGGYAKYQAAPEGGGESEAERMMNADVADYEKRGRVRDVSACTRWLEPRFPFEANGVRELGIALPVSFKIRGGVRKAVLREAAIILGVPEGLAGVPKKAAQYSSGIQKIVR